MQVARRDVHRDTVDDLKSVLLAIHLDHIVDPAGAHRYSFFNNLAEEYGPRDEAQHAVRIVLCNNRLHHKQVWVILK